MRTKMPLPDALPSNQSSLVQDLAALVFLLRATSLVCANKADFKNTTYFRQDPCRVSRGGVLQWTSTAPNPAVSLRASTITSVIGQVVLIL